MGFCEAGFTPTGFFLIIASFIGFGIGYFWICIVIAFVAFFATQMRSLYLVNEWISNRPYDVPPNIGGIWGALLFNVYRAQRQERIVQAEMVELIDRAQSSLVALQEAVVLLDETSRLNGGIRRLNVCSESPVMTVAVIS